MPFTYKIDTTLGLIFYTGFETNGVEMLEAEKTASTDPLRLSNMKILIDLSQTELDITLNDIYAALKMNRKRLEKGADLETTAIISHSRFAKILGDTFRLLGEDMPFQLGVFSTLSDAIRSLGLSAHEAKITELQAEILSQLRQKPVG